MSQKSSFVILAIMDGWGIAPASTGNAIREAHTPNINQFLALYPHGQLAASGEAVGLPRGEVGNTETGHINIGAGRIVYQDLARINMSIADGTFLQNKVLIEAINHANQYNSSLHLMGLVSSGEVHASINHLFSLLELAAEQNFKRVFIHMITDGRDSSPTSAKTYVDQLKQKINQFGVGQIASIMGRYWAMDRDFRWDRTQKAYLALTKGEGHLVKTIEEAIDMSYSQGKTDEFIEPSLVSSSEGKPLSLISENDSVIFFNFRIDRPRELTKAFILDDFSKANLDIGFDPYNIKYNQKHKVSTEVLERPLFDRGIKLQNLYFVTMTEYSKVITKSGAHVAFPPEVISMPLGRVISENHKSQLRVSESEKERFVTFYFNGLQELIYPMEEHMIVPSPSVPTYDLQPEMSAIVMTDTLLSRLTKNNYYSFIVINFANADMVGHTGNLQAAIKACEVVDQCIGKLANFALSYNGSLVITADHGNAEQMITAETGEVNTEHSANPVPLIIVDKNYQGHPVTIPFGKLSDIAPTILGLLQMSVPTSMSGRNLISSVSF